MRAGLSLLLLAVLLGACSEFAPGGASPGSGLELAVNPQAVVLPVGGRAVLDLTLIPSGDARGPALLTYRGLPEGVTASPGEVAVAGVTTARVTLEASTAAPLGTYAVTLEVILPGGARRSASFGLTVASQGGQGSGVPVRVFLPGGDARVYFSTDGATYRPLDFGGGTEAVFRAPGEYLLVARCEEMPKVAVVRAFPSLLPEVTLPCSPPPAPSTLSVTATALLPESLGASSPQDGDVVLMGEAYGVLLGGQATVSASVPRGASSLALVLARPTLEGGTPRRLDPLGFALHARSSPDESSFSLGPEDWRPFPGTARVLPPTDLPASAAGSLVVLFRPEDGAGYRVPVGYNGAYGVTGTPGSYLGFASYGVDLEDGRRGELLEVRRLSGEDWQASLLPLPDPAASAYDPTRALLSVGEIPGASLYFLQGPLLKDAGTGSSLDLTVLLTGPTRGFRLPVLPELAYAVDPAPATYTLGGAAGADLPLLMGLADPSGYAWVRVSSVRR